MIAVVNLEVIFLSLNPQKDLPPVALWSRTATWRAANKHGFFQAILTALAFFDEFQACTK